VISRGGTGQACVTESIGIKTTAIFLLKAGK